MYSKNTTPGCYINISRTIVDPTQPSLGVRWCPDFVFLAMNRYDYVKTSARDRLQVTHIHERTLTDSRDAKI